MTDEQVREIAAAVAKATPDNQWREIEDCDKDGCWDTIQIGTDPHIGDILVGVNDVRFEDRKVIVNAVHWLRILLAERERLMAFVTAMRAIPPLAEGHNSAHNWASMRVQEALAALDADDSDRAHG